MPEDRSIGDFMRRADLLEPMAIRVAATLRLADLVSDGFDTPVDIAQKTGADVRSVGSLLRYLASIELFVESSPDVFGLTDSGRILLDDHPFGIRWTLDLENGIGSRIGLAYVDLLQAVRTGKPVYAERFGRPFWDDVAGVPELNQVVHRMMRRDRGEAVDGLNAFIQEYDWADVEHVVDVGGGNGDVLIAVLRHLPNARGTLVELPGRTDGIRPRLDDSDVGDRCEVAAVDFFETLPAGADVYLMSNVLSDWDDDAAVAILRRCREAMRPSAHVVVIGGVPADRNEPGIADADMLRLAVLGGYERIASELDEVVRRAGLIVTRAVPRFVELARAD